MNKIKTTIIASIATLLSLTATAQQFHSSYFMSTSDMRHHLNPALLDHAYLTIPGTGSLNLSATGNLGYSDLIYKLQDNPEYNQTTFMSPTVTSDEFLKNIKNRNAVNLYLNESILSIGFKGLSGYNLLEFNIKSINNITLPRELFAFMKDTGHKEHYKLSDIGLHSQNYGEIVLGHSHKINQRLRIGAKIKILLGIAYADLDTKNMDITMNDQKWTIDADTRLSSAIMNNQFKYSDEQSPDGRRRVDGIDIDSFKLPGLGFALDLGATFRLNNNWQLSAAINDIGIIKWKNTLRASSSGHYEFDGFEDIYITGDNPTDNKIGKQFENIGDDLEDMFSIYDDGTTNTTSTLAATINLGAEYTLPTYDKLKFGILYSGRMAGLYSSHRAMLAANLRPISWFELNLNSAITSYGTTLGGAICLKAPHFALTIGADAILNKCTKQYIPLENTNAGINISMTIPL